MELLRELDHLSELVQRHTATGATRTAVPRQHLVCYDEQLAGEDLEYAFMVCVVAGGAKHAEVGGRAEIVSRGQMFLSLVDIPVVAAFEPLYRSVALEIDEQVVAAMMPEVSVAPSQSSRRAFQTAPADPALVGAMARWVSLLDEPEHIPVLSHLIEEEIVYRLLVGPLGQALRGGLSAGPVAQVRRATAYLLQHADQTLTVADIARHAGMSVPSLHRHFKLVTGLTPVQFQRLVRLQRARRLLVAGELTAAAVAHLVGYTSATQFSRDYARHYGAPPARDAARLRTTMFGDCASV